MTRDCYSRQKEGSTLKQHHQSAELPDLEAQIKFSQFALHTSTKSNPSTTTVGGDVQKVQEDNDSNNGYEYTPNPTTARYTPFREESDQETDMESNNEGEKDNDEDEDNKDDEEEDDDNDLIRYMSDTSDEVLKGQESSDINNIEREEKPQIDGIPNKSDWGDLPPCTHKSTWGNNLTNKSTKRS
jgi:hypothetical protein